MIKYKNSINAFLMLLLILIIISIISGFFGPFILWNRVSNYFDNFAHSAIFSLTLSNIFHLNEFYTLFLFAGLFSVLLCVCLFFKFKLNNNLLIIVSSLFIASAGIFNNYCSHDICNHNHQHENHSSHNHEEHENGIIQMFFGNNIENVQYKTLLPYLYIAICIGIISLFFMKKWLFNIINHQLLTQSKNFYLESFVFLFILGIFSTIAVKISGIMLAISTTIFPGLIAKNFSQSPYQMILYSIFIATSVTIISFFICQKFDIHYNGFVVIFEFLIFITSSLIKNFRNKRLSFKENLISNL
jgi:ABC-type Mn2+/Zn2+ transport system permease subunit